MSGPKAATWASKAARSSPKDSTNAWATVPAVGTPYRRPASRLDVDAKPAEVGGPGRSHRRLGVGAPAAHLDDGAVPCRLG